MILIVSGNNMQIEYTEEFKRCLKKIRDKGLQVKIEKIVEKIIENPDVGKPLQYELAGMRSVRVPPFRIFMHILTII